MATSAETSIDTLEEREDDAGDIEALIRAFAQSYLASREGQKHRQAYDDAIRTGRANFALVQQVKQARGDITDLVLRKLLPHTNSERHRQEGDWIHVAPAITKYIRSWYEGAGLSTPEEWPAKASLILHFVEKAIADPDDIETLCRFFASEPLSKGFQSGMLTPIINALRPDRFAIVNSKVIKTLAALKVGEFKTAIVEYPRANAALRNFVERHRSTLSPPEAEGMEPERVFDMFAHWYVSVRGHDEQIDEPEDSPRALFDRTSPSEARRIIEDLCPDPAPRAVVLGAFASAIRFAHDLSANAWSITLGRRSAQLSVGGIVALKVKPNGLKVVVHQPSIAEESREVVRSFDTGVQLRYLERVHAYLLPYNALDPALSLLREGNQELMRRAIAKSTSAPFRASHSSGVLAYLRSVGNEVPDPAHTPTVTSQGVQGPKRVGGVVNPAYPVEDLIRDVYGERAVVETWIRSINRKGQAIVYGPPGTGKTFTAERIAKHLVGGGDGIVDLVQFHPAYSYEDFMVGLRPQAHESGQIEFREVPGRFFQFCETAAKRAGTSVLIIDEINRANIAQVFGELMYLLEYRDREIRLAGGRSLRIPPHVRVIGTMNTADRSIALVDHALRRRFSFIRLDPDFRVLQHYHQQRERDVSPLVDVLRRLNGAIGDAHYAVGISYFMRESLKEDLPAIWQGEIEPYVEELLFDKPKLVDEFRWSRIQGEVGLE